MKINYDQVELVERNNYRKMITLTSWNASSSDPSKIFVQTCVFQTKKCVLSASGSKRHTASAAMYESSTGKNILGAVIFFGKQESACQLYEEDTLSSIWCVARSTS